MKNKKPLISFVFFYSGRQEGKSLPCILGCLLVALLNNFGFTVAIRSLTEREREIQSVRKRHMMATAAIIGLATGKMLLNSSSSYNSDITEKLFHLNDHAFLHCHFSSTKNLVTARKSNSNYTSSRFPSSNRPDRSSRALKEHVDAAFGPSSTAQQWFHSFNDLEEESSDLEYSVDALLLLQKSMLEKQWNLSFEKKVFMDSTIKTATNKRIPVTCSGVSARHRRMSTRRNAFSANRCLTQPSTNKPLRPVMSPELLQNRLKGYVKGVLSEDLLTHTEVVRLSKKIKIGLSVEEHKSRLKERLGCEPSDKQLATSLRISRTELLSKLIECSLAREKLAMSNVRLVMSIAQKYDNMGAEMADLIQGGLIGLLRGIEKFDSSKGFKISTYVYWWIRQGVSRALVENSKTLRLPTHLHERLGLIRNAKIRLEEKGITPSIDRIAESLNMSRKKVRNATEAIGKVFSLDRDAFPSLNGLPGETHHSYIADNRLENVPWNGVDALALKDEVNKLINMMLGDREREIIRLYYGLDNECLTWEDISKRVMKSNQISTAESLVVVPYSSYIPGPPPHPRLQQHHHLKSFPASSSSSSIQHNTNTNALTVSSAGQGQCLLFNFYHPIPLRLRRHSTLSALDSDVPHPLHQGSVKSTSSKTGFEQWNSWTAKFSGASNIPFLLLQMPQIYLNAQNLLAGNKAALLAVPWMLSMADAMPLPYFVITSIVVATGLVLNFLNYFGWLNAGLWRFWEDFITVGGLSVLPQIMWSTFVPYIPNSILPGALAFVVAVVAVVMARMGKLSEGGIKFVGGISGWTATLLFMWMPVSQMWTNFLNPDNIKGLSASSMLLAMIGNGLMIPRALFICDLMWFNSISKEFFVAATTGLFLWIGMALWRDAVVNEYGSPFTSLKELVSG
ncbi:hypothetical protein DVH24_022259 [Malus domestica]|uniref:RNA polymerase sigma-70 domain-containing protein n=1 Tax=Malus domestica TaxID=3750 RepID=A0A498KQX6_MALDO|nr:hypothetical protein DVH24_022259 [Malus domestica]